MHNLVTNARAMTSAVALNLNGTAIEDNHIRHIEKLLDINAAECLADGGKDGANYAAYAAKQKELRAALERAKARRSGRY